MNSILTSVKKDLGLEEDYEIYDHQIITEINSALFVLSDLGIGPEGGYIVEDKSNSWSEFIGDRKDLASVKSYIYQRVRLNFDPPGNSFLITAIQTNLSELEWRLSIKT